MRKMQQNEGLGPELLQEFVSLYGGFIVSKNVNAGKKITYSFREKSSIPNLNGWTLLADEDGDDCFDDPHNFTVVGMQTILRLAPVMMALFDAPYGTELAWTYQNNEHTGFYDVVHQCSTDMEHILNGGPIVQEGLMPAQEGFAAEYGMFLVTRSVLQGAPVALSARERQESDVLNGWTLYAAQDDPRATPAADLLCVPVQKMLEIAPVMTAIAHAPYGTCLRWIYENGLCTALYDEKRGRSVTLHEIIAPGSI